MTTDQLWNLRKQIIDDMNAKGLRELLTKEEYDEFLCASFAHAWETAVLASAS